MNIYKIIYSYRVWPTYWLKIFTKEVRTMTHKERMESMSVEEKKAYNEKKKIAAKAYQERKREASTKVLEWLKTDPKIPEDVKQSMLYLTGGSTVKRTGAVSELKAMILEKKSVSSVDIFNSFEYGRPTMEQKIRGFIKVANPEDRIWVAFENGNYVLKGTGPNPPKGWTGYVPTEKSEL